MICFGIEDDAHNWCSEEARQIGFLMVISLGKTQQSTIWLYDM